MKKAYLLLADGTLFEGTAVGYEGQSIGEVVFNTGMAGYQEVLTDPSYYGQVVTMTYPLVGNYGINFDDYESRMYFDRQLRKSGLFDRLEEQGIEDGDTVSIYDFEFDYTK